MLNHHSRFIVANKSRILNFANHIKPSSVTFFSSNALSSTEENVIKKNVSVVLWGHVHRCPMAFRLLNQALTQVDHKKIPFIFCKEEAADVSFERLLEAYRLIIMKNNFLITSFPIIKSLIKNKPSLSHNYFSLDDLESITKILKPFLLQQNVSPAAVSQICFLLLRHFALFEDAELMEKLIKLKATYVGIEPTCVEQKKIYDHMHNPALNPEEAYMSQEQVRTNFMVDTIFQNALQQSSKGGVIFVLLGNNHVHRVAANLWMKFHALHQENINVFPLKIFSPYVMDGIPSHKATEAKTRALDASTSQHAYDSVICEDIICEDNKEKNIYGSFKLDQIMKNVTDLCHSSSEITVQRHPSMS